MKKTLLKLFSIALLCSFESLVAGNYKDKIFKKDSVFSVFREAQIGKNFFNTTNNNYYAYSSKLGMQMYCFQVGVMAEREFNFTNAYNDNYIQRNKSFGAFFGIELPVSNKLDIGLVGTASFYKPFIERTTFQAISSNLFEINYSNIYQAQLRFNYKIGNEFSLLGTANFNLSQQNRVNTYIDKNNFFRVNLGLRYRLFPFENSLNNTVENNKINVFIGSNLAWKNSYVPNFIGKEETVSNTELLKLAQTGSEVSSSQVFPLIGISDKKNNMILFGFNQRDFTQFSQGYQLLFSSYNWKMEMKDISSRMALELNLFSLAGDKITNIFKPVYPFYRLTATYSNKSIYVSEGWDNTKYATDSTYYRPRVDNKAQTKSIEINNSLGLAMKLNKLYLSAGINVFNRTTGEVKFQRTVTRDYYYNAGYQNFIESKTETLPELNTKGWLAKPKDPINVFFTIGLVL